jgi:hypothetical protein
MSEPTAPQRLKRLSRIATFTTVLLLTVAVGTAAAQQPGPFESFLRGMLNRIKLLAELAILIAIIAWVVYGFFAGRVTYGIKMAGLGVVALVIIESINFLLQLARNAGGQAENTSNASAPVESAFHTTVGGLDPTAVATHTPSMLQHTLTHLTGLTPIL